MYPESLSINLWHERASGQRTEKNRSENIREIYTRTFV